MTILLSTFEACAGAGGQALGLERAGFDHVLLVDNDPFACATLLANRPAWPVSNADLRSINGRSLRGVDVFAAGVPCPPFSVAGKQLGEEDGRDLFPVALRLVEQVRPIAVILENVPGFASTTFDEYRRDVCARLLRLGYEPRQAVLNASEYSVPQLRPRFLLVAVLERYAQWFEWPVPLQPTRLVGDVSVT